jgi:ribosomal protein S18 acetylase RimI-like enzyme
MIINEFTIRPAIPDDIPFLVDTIIEAEKSGTSVLTYTTIFGLTEAEARECIAKMLEEGVDGCELSVSGFILAEKDNQIAGAVGEWIEGSEGIPSGILKGNLLRYTLPPQCFEKASTLNKIVNDLHIEYVTNTIQIGLVYVAPEARGKGLVSILIDHKIDSLKESNPHVKEAYVQVFGNNLPAIRAYEKAGFETVFRKDASLLETSDFMPYTSKILMKKYH